MSEHLLAGTSRRLSRLVAEKAEGEVVPKVDPPLVENSLLAGTKIFCFQRVNARESLVPEVGVEPTRPEGHSALNAACIPISALGLTYSLS